MCDILEMSKSCSNTTENHKAREMKETTGF